jgi:hypothetical protein
MKGRAEQIIGTLAVGIIFVYIGFVALSDPSAVIGETNIGWAFIVGGVIGLLSFIAHFLR